MTFKIGILSNTSRSVDMKFDEANKEVKEKTQEVKKEFKTNQIKLEEAKEELTNKLQRIESKRI